jgi:hypothetical protein
MSGQPFLGFLKNDQSVFSKSGGLEGAFRNGPGDSAVAHEAWLSPHRLTVSLAPDGTAVSTYSSSLFQSFENLFPGENLERLVTDAMQSWTSSSNLNFGFVPDSGDPFGVSGLTQGDERFGDIRLSAIPLGDEVFAVATSIERGVAGTWAGDILFNSNAKFNSMEQFYSVLVHELGHSLGLAHSTGATDVMNPDTFNSVQSAGDIAALQAIYGRRQIDQYDGTTAGHRNDTIDSATRIKNPGSFKGTVPLVVYGDVESAADADFFELRSLDGYADTITFRVVSAGISLLAPEISVYSEQGRLLGSNSSRSIVGDEMIIRVQARADESLFLRVGSSLVADRSVGSYAMVATFDNVASYDAALLERVLHEDYSALEQSDVHTLFTEPAPRFNDDLHTNDTFASATLIETLAGSENATRYRIQAGISDLIDIDFYRFSTPEFAGGAPGVLNASLTSMEQLGLVAKMEFFDASMHRLPSRVIARGGGRYVLQVDGMQENSDYFVSIAADRPGLDFDTGNYSLDLSFESQPYLLNSLGGGELSGRNRKSLHSLYVAETQMFHFGIEAGANPSLQNSILWMTVRNEAGGIIWRGATRPGEFRSANSVVMQPGSYSIEVELALIPGPVPRGKFFGINYVIRGRNVTDPMGPELINPANLPFPHCKPASPEYCYPGDRHTTDPFILVNGGEVPVPPGSPPPPSLQDVNLWYWYQNWQNGMAG